MRVCVYAYSATSTQVVLLYNLFDTTGKQLCLPDMQPNPVVLHLQTTKNISLIAAIILGACNHVSMTVLSKSLSSPVLAAFADLPLNIPCTAHCSCLTLQTYTHAGRMVSWTNYLV